MNPKIYFYYLIIILISFSCKHSPTGGGEEGTTTGGDTSTTTGGGEEGTTTGGDTSTTTGGGEFSDLFIGFGSILDNSVEIFIETPHDIAGFEFDVSGITLNQAFGGLADAAGFSVSTGTNNGKVIGFSLVGNVISAGSSGILTNLEYDTINYPICIDSESVVMADSLGAALESIIGDCIEY